MCCYLLYCIFPRSARQPTAGLRGVDLQPILEINSNGLSAAVSEMDCKPPAHNVSQLLIYESVIAALHRKQTLIPIRFGSLLDGPSSVIRLLDERGAAFKATLRVIRDCYETGIHILVENRPPSEADSSAYQEKTTDRPGSLKENGTSYLAARRQYYDRIDKDVVDYQHLSEQFRSDLAGLFVRSIMDDHRQGLPFVPSYIRVVSFRFLVPQLFLHDFCSAAKGILAKLNRRSFLSAPSPPYSFVAPDPL